VTAHADERVLSESDRNGQGGVSVKLVMWTTRLLPAIASMLLALTACATHDHISATGSRQSASTKPTPCRADATIDGAHVERAVPALQRRARHVLGSDFGGLYFDPGCATVASSVSDPGRFRIIEAAFPFPDSLQFKVVDFSYRELRQTQMDLIRLRLPGSSDVDVRANRVVFWKSKRLTPDARRALAALGESVRVAPGIFHVDLG
jgi:hypothetical protein